MGEAGPVFVEVFPDNGPEDGAEDGPEDGPEGCRGHGSGYDSENGDRRRDVVSERLEVGR